MIIDYQTYMRSQDEFRRLRARLREVTQIIVSELGAQGPMNAEEAARACIAKIEQIRDERAAAEHQASTLRDENGTLRHQVADLQMQRDEHLIDNGNAYDEGYDAGTRRGYEAECAAVVAYLRAAANAPHPIERGVPSLSPAGRGLLLLHADRIERGEHRREGER